MGVSWIGLVVFFWRERAERTLFLLFLSTFSCLILSLLIRDFASFKTIFFAFLCLYHIP